MNMADINPTIPIIIMNINSQNAPIKRDCQRRLKKIKKQDPPIRCLQ